METGRGQGKLKVVAYPHTNPHDDGVGLSIVIPVLNEEENVAPLLREIAAVLEPRGDYEVIFVDDGSTDGTCAALAAEKARHPRLRIIAHERNAGQSAALRTGILAARGDIVVTLDGDGQNDPADIPALIAALESSGNPHAPMMVAGQRRNRRDSMIKRAASSIANGIRQRLLNDGMRDTGCGLKAFRREGYLRLPYFDHMHRYLPALMIREGYRVERVDVGHRRRRHGRSKYGVFDRLLVALSDILGVMWLCRRSRLPGARKEL